jgi:hypothetical protein
VIQEWVLKIFAFYKQATVGDAPPPEEKPFESKAQEKWEVWDKWRGTPQDVAKRRYITYAPPRPPRARASAKRSLWQRRTNNCFLCAIGAGGSSGLAPEQPPSLALARRTNNCFLCARFASTLLRSLARCFARTLLRSARTLLRSHARCFAHMLATP